MKAMVYHDYGSPDVLHCEEIEKPFPNDDQVLIKVHAASVNPLDVGLMKGRPYIFRLLFGLPKPKVTRPGRDVAGEVEAIGKNVTQFKPGDKVFGICTSGGWMKKTDGAFAEYACTLESGLSKKPESVSYEQAASVPVAACTALQALRDKGKLHAGQKVLIHGAGGGVGTFAVQIAKAFGAEVTAVSAGENMGLLRAIGADHVLDYDVEDFTQRSELYDLIFDCYATHPVQACKQVLSDRGTYIKIGGPVSVSGMLAQGISMLVLSKLGPQKFEGFLARVTQRDLNFIGQMMDKGELRPVIDRCYELNDVPDAMRYLDEGHAHGKVVIRVG